MNKKTAGRISAMAMASMMMMSVCVVNASAEENEPITQLNLKKTVTTDGNTYQPNTSFSFHEKIHWQQLTARMQHWKLIQRYLNMLVFIIML